MILRDQQRHFERNTTYEACDLIAMIGLGLRGARNNPPPPDLKKELDPYFWSRRFANKPNQLFTTARDGDLHIAKIQSEVEPEAIELGQDNEDWIAELFKSELELAAAR